MNIIYNGRRKGKTTELIKMSAEKNLYILVVNRNRQREVFELARDLNLNIPFPITVEEYFTSGKLRGSFINTILIDDADDILQQIFNTVVIDTITITDKEDKEMNISHIADEFVNKQIIFELESLRAKLHETAEMHMDGDYYLRDEWIDEYIDKRIAELKGESNEE